MPCPLCIFQRIATILLGLLFLVAALHDPAAWGRRLYAVLMALIGGTGAAIAAWHVHLQSTPSDGPAACGPGLDYMFDSFPLSDALGMVFSGSGDCTAISWMFLGLSMPAWVLILFAALLAWALAVNFRTLPATC